VIQDELAFGWSRVSVTFELPMDDKSSLDYLVHSGLVVTLLTENPQEPFEFTLRLGRLSISPSQPLDVVPYEPRLIWGDINFSSENDSELIEISWDAGVCFTQDAIINTVTIEDPNPPWLLDRRDTWYPGFAYFNVYALSRSNDNVLKPEDATFIGTSGVDGFHDRLYIQRNGLPDALRQGALRVYVQGVTDQGDILDWSRCVFIDTD